jgi:sugar lactone lactonase YvrE
MPPVSRPVALVVLLAACQRVPGPPPGPAPERFASGLPSLQAVAFNPQGLPFVALADSGGRVARLVAADRTHGLTETGGSPSALAFASGGDLFVADRRRGAVYRVTPWGLATLAADWLGAPQGLAAAGDGSLYFTDSERAAVYRLDNRGALSQIASSIPGARGIALSSETGRLYVSAAERKIWTIAPAGGPAALFATLRDAGDAAGLALDEAGYLYVARDGGGKVTVLDPKGGVAASYSLPGPRVVSLAFGGLDLRTLYVAEATQGALYRLRLARRAQRLPWEPEMPLRITSPADGDILNRHDGETTPDGLRITVEGESRAPGQVTVNGTPAQLAEGRFRALALLKGRETTITAETPAGARHTITVFWDRGSDRRYRVSTDDNILFLKDIAEHAETYRSIFDNPYLAFWRQMHDKYGAKIQHNIYYETPGFNLSQMPEKFKSEWRQNAAWMRLSFHARSNDPDRPYVHASPDRLLADYRLVTREIERFAGKETLSSFTTIHWGEATEAAVAALRREGVRGLAGYFRAGGDFPSVSYYLNLPQVLHLMNRDYWKDTVNDILFVRHDIVINTIPLAEIVPYLEKLSADPHQAEVMELMIHEQYFYPNYRAYEPDFRQRVERAIEFVHRRGYRPVFYDEGFVGARP